MILARIATARYGLPEVPMATKTGTLEELIRDAYGDLLTARRRANHFPNAATYAAELGAEREVDRLLDLWREAHAE